MKWFKFILGCFVACTVLTHSGFSATISADVEIIYNSSSITIPVSNDWVSSGGIDDNLVFSNFSNTGNSVSNNGNIELKYQEETYNNPNGYTLGLSKSEPVGWSPSWSSGANEQDTLNKFCDDMGVPGVQSSTHSYAKPILYYNGNSWGSLNWDGQKFNTIVCGNGWSVNEIIKKIYITTKEFNKFTLSDSKVLNGGTIISKLKYDGVEYGFTNGIINKVIPSGATIELIYYISGDGTQTPQLSNIHFTASNILETPQVEMFYYLNNGIKTSVGNVTSYDLTLNNLEDKTYLIQFFTKDENGETSITKNFIIDTTKPTININKTESTTYLVNWNNYFNYADPNYNSCNVYYDNLVLNCNSYTFATPGTKNIKVKVIDKAGNIQTQSFNLFINPYQYFYFTEPDGTKIQDFKFGDHEFVNYAKIPLFDYGYGIHNISFAKYGFAETNITINFDSTSKFNQSNQITIAILTINYRDRDTRELIKKPITLDITGDKFSKRYTTSIGQLTVLDIRELPDMYNINTQSLNYAIMDYYFTHTGYSSLNLTLYLLNLTKTPNPEPIKLILRDEYYETKKQCLFKVKQQFVTSDNVYNEFVDMGYTNSIGEVIFYLEFDKKYQWVIECGGITQTEPNQKITNNIIYIDWKPNQIYPNIPQFPNIKGKVNYIDNNSKYFKFEFDNKENTPIEVCLNVEKQQLFEKEIISNQCLKTSSGSLYADIDLDYNDSLYIATGYILQNGIKTPIDTKIQNFRIESERGAWNKGLGEYSAFIIIAVLVIIGAAIHPFAIAFFGLLGVFITYQFSMISIPYAGFYSLSIGIVGIIIWRIK